MFLQTFIRKFIHTIIPLIIGILFSVAAEAQNFNYSFSKDSVAWQELNSQTILNTNNSAWNFFYKIPLGFTFNYLGVNFDSLRIETNGYFIFDEDRNFSFMAYNAFSEQVDGSGNHSVLGYQLSGSSGNHILKIQLKNIGLGDGSVFSYQLWIKESGNIIEIHQGPNEYTEVDPSVPWIIGPINMNMDTNTNGIFLTGDPVDPTVQVCDNNNPEIGFMIIPPQQGMLYIFTPNP